MASDWQAENVFDVLGWVSYHDDYATKTIIHFDGPMSFERYGPPVAIPRGDGNSRRSSLRLMLGTPGVGKGTFASYDELCSEQLGPIQADIWMSSTKTEAAVAVRVDDVDLLGKATPITTGLMSASFRAVDLSRSRFINGVMVQPWHPFTVASKQAVVPGQPMLVPVEVFPAAALIRKGHKLRIAISASNQAQGVWPTPQQADANGNVSTIYSDPAHPSSVVLPIVPTSALN